MKFNELLRQACEEHRDAADCERRNPELYEDLIAAIWKEDSRDLTEIVLTHEKDIAENYRNAAEIGRIFQDAMRKMVRKQVENAIYLGREVIELKRAAG